jgi:hypothetical protein
MQRLIAMVFLGILVGFPTGCSLHKADSFHKVIVEITLLFVINIVFIMNIPVRWETAKFRYPLTFIVSEYFMTTAMAFKNLNVNNTVVLLVMILALNTLLLMLSPWLCRGIIKICAPLKKVRN